MADIELSKCPKCGDTSIELSTFLRAELDDLLTCPACWHKALKPEFVPPERPMPENKE